MANKRSARISMFNCVLSQAKATIHQAGLLVKEQEVAMKKVSRVGRILVFIPVLFVLLRVWAVVQYFYTIYLTHLTDESGRCIPSDPHKTIHVALGVLQVRFSFLIATSLIFSMLYYNCDNFMCFPAKNHSLISCTVM